MSLKLLKSMVTVAVALGLTVLGAKAQEHIVAIAGPPAGFNPLTASPGDLAKYGFPPRPDPLSAPKAFAIWEKAVSHDRERILDDTVIGGFVHSPAVRVGKTASSSSGTKADLYFYNWSGPIIYDPNRAFASSSIMGFWHVPIAQHAFGRPAPGLDVSAQWVGIDGYDTPDVFQAGTECDVTWHANEVNAPNYYFWFEWFPYPEHQIRLPVTAGDIVFINVWNVSPTVGYAYFVNLSTNRGATYLFGAPPGYALVGDTAEWIVEKPGLIRNGRPVLTHLTNYVGQAFAFCTVNGITGNFNPGASLTATPNPGSGTTYLGHMLASNYPPGAVPYQWIISQSFLAGDQAIWFWDEGSAR